MAATPAGLEAMKQMQESSASKIMPGTATNSMCTFLILNISSLQLIPINLLAYRSQYGSNDPAAVLGPALLATACSSLAAIIFCKVADVCAGGRIVRDSLPQQGNIYRIRGRKAESE